MKFKDTNVMIVVKNSNYQEDLKDQKNQFSKSMFIKDKHYKTQIQNIIKVEDGFKLKSKSMNQIKNYIIQDQ